MKLPFFMPRLFLILLGVAVGLAARNLLGPPEVDSGPPMTIDRPLLDAAEEVIDLPLLNPDGTPFRSDDLGSRSQADPSGIVSPITLPGSLGVGSGLAPVSWPGAQFSHDPTAIFEAHGHELCASGCAASRHPTAELTEDEYWQLLTRMNGQALDRENEALETLLYFGPQTRQWIEALGVGSLNSEAGKFLSKQLQYTHAVIELRVVDQAGEIRSWLDSTTVPLDRRHVFEMEVRDLQPLVTSGTVKRVGLGHMWVRL